MIRLYRLVITILLLLVLPLNLFGNNAAQAQSAVRTIFGTNVEDPGYAASIDGAYVDVLRKGSAWSGGGYVIDLTTDGYPSGKWANSDPNTQLAATFFTFVGYTPGHQLFNFYAEGIFDFGIYGNEIDGGGVVPGSLKKTVNSAGVTVTTFQISVTVPAAYY
jgi:hypothetical protein